MCVPSSGTSSRNRSGPCAARLTHPGSHLQWGPHSTTRPVADISLEIPLGTDTDTDTDTDSDRITVEVGGALWEEHRCTRIPCLSSPSTCSHGHAIPPTDGGLLHTTTSVPTPHPPLSPVEYVVQPMPLPLLPPPGQRPTPASVPAAGLAAGTGGGGGEEAHSLGVLCLRDVRKIWIQVKRPSSVPDLVVIGIDERGDGRF